MRIAALALVLGLIGGAPAAAATPRDDGEPAPTLHCLERVALPVVTNPLETQWSPDGRTLAVSWFAGIPSRRSPTGLEETAIIDLLDVRTGRVRPLGVGERPRWSTSGDHVSYWGPDADELRVVRDERVVARLAPTIPEVRWVGDALLFIEKDAVREWREGAVRTLAHLDEEYVPRYPRDDVYFSADGRSFTLTRYSLDGDVERFVGETANGAIAPLVLDDARHTEWSPTGATLLVRYPGRIELRGMDGTLATVALPAPGTVHLWAPDGARLLLGRVSPTVPAGDAFDVFRLPDPARADAVATIPNVLGERVFSANGRYFAGASRVGAHRTRLEVYRCRGAADGARDIGDAPARRAAVEAETVGFVRPAAGEVTQYVRGAHTGVDVAAPLGSLVVSAADGVVTEVGWVRVGGEHVCVRHDPALVSCYYHIGAALVVPGERVSRGQPVALIGMTGLTTGPHTHWEVKLAGRIVDPLVD